LRKRKSGDLSMTGPPAAGRFGVNGGCGWRQRTPRHFGGRRLWLDQRPAGTG